MNKSAKPPRNDRIAVLVSGGLDSAVLVGELSRRHRVQPVYVSQGLAWEDVEIYWLSRYLKAIHSSRMKPLKVLIMPMRDVYGDHWSLGKKAIPGSRSDDRAVYLPGRNLTLLVKTGVYCAMQKISTIALGSLGHNPFSDATPAFFQQWSKTLGMALKSSVTIKTPYRAMTKVQVIQRGKVFPLELSFSCLAPVGIQHCGRCNKCAERKKAFKKAGVEDKTSYAKA